MHSRYDHELSTVEDCLDPCLNNNVGLVNHIVIFCIIYLQLSCFPALDDAKII
jgi:hypothetical protein